jgi:hypothetical protein
MYHIKYIIFIILLFCSFSVFSQDYPFPSTRPGFSTGVYPIGLGNIAFEAGFSKMKSFAFDYNFINNLEFRFEDDFPGYILSFKYLIYNPIKLPAIAILYNYQVNNSNILLLMQKSFGNFTLVYNTGIDIKHDLINSCSLTYNITNKIGANIEVYNRSYDIGITYLINKNIQLDISYYRYNIINGGFIWRINKIKKGI